MPDLFNVIEMVTDCNRQKLFESITFCNGLKNVENFFNNNLQKQIFLLLLCRSNNA